MMPFARKLSWLSVAAGLLLGPAAAAQSDPVASAEASEQAPTERPEDILKNIVVAATDAARPLPKIAVNPSLASDMSDVTLQNVVRRDLDLCGEFELLPDSAAPDNATLTDTVDVAAYKKKGADFVVKLVGKTVAAGKVQLTAQGWIADAPAGAPPDRPAFDKTIETEEGQTRVDAHRLADAIIGAFTGTPGGFSSEMTFVFGHGKARRVYVMDADGHEPRAVSSPDGTALSPTFGPNHQLYWTASRDHGAFRLYQAGQDAPIDLDPRGSVYGIAFSRKNDKVALSIARGSGIELFAGPDLQHLSAASHNTLAMHPVWSPTDKLAFVGDTKWGERIFVDDKPISPAGLQAAAPVFCRHPDGIRALYTVGFNKTSDIVASGETGGGIVRLTQGGMSSYPACSPDGRLVAFFSNRRSGEGPGLYIMRIDGTRPKRISPLVGDSLHWARLPAGKVQRIQGS